METKIVLYKYCNKEISVHKNASISNCSCSECTKARWKKNSLKRNKTEIKRIRHWLERTNVCLECKKEFTYKSYKERKFCSQTCNSLYSNRIRSKNKYSNYLNNQELFCGKVKNIKPLYKYFLEEQNYLCAICFCKQTHNNKPLVFICDHIDGNAANNMRNNLRMICPNCDTQLDTYKSKNKNSARHWRRGLTVGQ